jgi:hypothetical protein
MLFAETDDDGEPLDKNFDADDIANETRDEIRTIAERFYDLVRPIFPSLEYVGGSQGEYTAAECLGHDLWFTSRGHGVGFSESGRWAIDGKAISGDNNSLSVACRKAHAGENCECPYVGDDGKIYLL